VPTGLSVNQNNLIVELLNLDRGGRKLVTLFREGGKFTASISLPAGTYEIKPLGKFLTGGTKVFKIKQRNIVLKMYKLIDNQRYVLKYEDSFPSSERNLVALADLEYALTDADKEIYKIDLSVVPIFSDERLIVSHDKEIYAEVSFKGRKFYPVPIMYSKDTQGKILIKGTYEGMQNSNSFTYNIKIERDENIGIEKLETESMVKVADVKEIAIDADGDVNKIGSYNIYLQFNIVGKSGFLAKRWASFVGVLIALSIVAALIIIWKLRTLPKDPDLLDKVAKAWDLKKLREFYEKLNQPISYAERELNTGESLSIGYMPSGSNDIRLRDKSVEVYMDIGVRMEKGNAVMEANSMSGFIKAEARTVTRYVKKIR